MDYYEKKNIRTTEMFKYSLVWLAYAIIFWTLYNINIWLFSITLLMVIFNKIFKWHIMCKLFGHIESNHIKHGIVRCKRCNQPLYRIK